LGRLAAAALAAWLGMGGRSAFAAWEAEQWLAAGFGAVALAGAAAILLCVSAFRRATRLRAAYRAELEQLGNDSAIFRDARAGPNDEAR
jgi:hypothetical protein